MQPQANVDWIQVAWFEAANVRAYLAAPSESVQAEPAKEEAPKVYLSDYCADLDKMPKLYNKKGKKGISKKIKFAIDN